MSVGSRLPVVALMALAAACGGPPMPQELPGAPKTARSASGVVVAAQPLAAEAGARILEAGGNAADAAVAAAFAISVVEPSMNSIGGRTQVLLRTPGGEFHGIDATTQAPWTYDPTTADEASYGYGTIGIPGAVAGLTKLLEEHGTLSLRDVMAPAIQLARKGFRLLPGEAARHRAVQDQIREFPGTRSHFLGPSGETNEAGTLFVQEDLARTLEIIAEGGAEAFYEGAIAEAMAADLQAGGSPVTREALEQYRAEDSRIVRGSYRGFDLVGTDIPASGAVTIGILHVLENFDMAGLDDEAWAGVVGQAVAKGLEYRTMLGTAEDAKRFLDKAFAARVAAEIDVPGVELARAALVPQQWESREPSSLPSRVNGRLALVGEVAGQATGMGQRSMDWTGATWGAKSTHTTHLSTADRDGMLVALTQTIGPNLGSKVVTPGLGFTYAATLGGYLSSVAGGERARSSISPLMVLADGEPRLVLGAAGGARIVSAVVQAVCRFVDQGLSLPEALAAARVHPVEGGLSMETSPGIGWGDAVVDSVESWGFEVR
ncbi:MAG: gamma-glutamyltransferase, partial [Gemmatimonadota bacterium]|nr:gamma-glutamyltransferase [Gemmatimonadota bacterium]